MKDLQKRIRNMEMIIQRDQTFLLSETTWLFSYLHTPKFVGKLMLGGFALGFLIGFRENYENTKRRLQKAPGFIASVYRNVRFVLPLIV